MKWNNTENSLSLLFFYYRRLGKGQGENHHRQSYRRPPAPEIQPVDRRVLTEHPNQQGSGTGTAFRRSLRQKDGADRPGNHEKQKQQSGCPYLRKHLEATNVPPAGSDSREATQSHEPAFPI